MAPRNPEETRSRLLETAEREFARHGYAGARVARIARNARTNQRMVYHYFGGKRGMYETVLRHVADELLGQLRAAVAARPEGAASDTYADLIRTYFRVVNRHPTWSRLAVHESFDGFRSLNRVTSQGLAEEAAPFMELIKRAKAEGSLRNDASPETGFVMAAFLAIFYPLFRPHVLGQAHMDGERDPDRLFPEAMLAVILHGVQTGR